MTVPRAAGAVRFLPECGVALGLVAMPYALPHLGGTLDLAQRILDWGLFGLGFDILFGFTGLLAFGQAAFFGTGGFTAAYLLTAPYTANTLLALAGGTAAAAVLGAAIGILSLRRAGIYFAMLTLAFGEMAYFLEISPLATWTGGENGIAGVPAPHLALRTGRARPCHAARHVLAHRGVVLRRFLAGALHRPLVLRHGAARHSRQRGPRPRGRSRRGEIQAHGLRHRCRLWRACGRTARPAARLHAARRLLSRHLGAARGADRHRWRRHADRAARRCRGMALSLRRAAASAGHRFALEVAARRHFRRAGDGASPRHHRRRRHAVARIAACAPCRAGSGAGRHIACGRRGARCPARAGAAQRSRRTPRRGSQQALRRRDRRRRGLVRAGRGRGACGDRPERRRQVDILQHARGRARRDGGRGPVPRPASHRS